LLKSCSSAELLSSSDSKIKIRKILKKEKKFGLIIEFGGINIQRKYLTLFLKKFLFLTFR